MQWGRHRDKVAEPRAAAIHPISSLVCTRVLFPCLCLMLWL